MAKGGREGEIYKEGGRVEIFNVCGGVAVVKRHGGGK